MKILGALGATLVFALALSFAQAETSEGRSARVAGGQTVKIADSKFTAKELAEKRPNFAALIPKVR